MKTAVDLAAELRVDPKQFRVWLRKTFPRHEKNSPWVFHDAEADAIRRMWRNRHSASWTSSGQSTPTASSRSRASSDEAYVIDLCDEILGEKAQRQHRFDWLRGDPNEAGVRARLPVDAYYPRHDLVVEYRERQHSEPVAFFDKPDRLTVSGVHRGEQRARYDRRREEEIPRHGLRLLVIQVTDLASAPSGKLLRDVVRDTAVLARVLLESTASK